MPFHQPRFSINTLLSILQIQFGGWNWFQCGPDAVNIFSVTCNFPLKIRNHKIYNYYSALNQGALNKTLFAPRHLHHIYFIFYLARAEKERLGSNSGHRATLLHWLITVLVRVGCHPELRPPSQGAKFLVRRAAFESTLTEGRSPFHN